MALALIVSAAVGACPAVAASNTANARALILRPLSIVNDGPLNFGRILASATAGTVTIDPATQVRSTTGGVTPLGGTVTAAKFIGWADGRTHVKIDVPAGSITITRAGGTETMLVDQFGTDVPRNNWLPPNDIFTFYVGARLRVGANQVPGVYSGTFNVTVVYR